MYDHTKLDSHLPVSSGPLGSQTGYYAVLRWTHYEPLRYVYMLRVTPEPRRSSQTVRTKLNVSTFSLALLATKA